MGRVFFFLLVFPVLIVYAGIQLLGMLLGSAQITFDCLLGIAIGVYWFRVVPKALKAEINSNPIIRVVDQGLIVRVFTLGYEWAIIPWEDVIEVIPSPLFLQYGLVHWVIKINALEDTHLIYGKRFSDGASPAILLPYYMKNRDKLIDIIEEKLNTR